jgi:hypothetical protein
MKIWACFPIRENMVAIFTLAAAIQSDEIIFHAQK